MKIHDINIFFGEHVQEKEIQIGSSGPYYCSFLYINQPCQDKLQILLEHDSAAGESK